MPLRMHRYVARFVFHDQDVSKPVQMRWYEGGERFVSISRWDLMLIKNCERAVCIQNRGNRAVHVKTAVICVLNAGGIRRV